MGTDKIRDKIAKLLAKAERTDNDHERDTFTAAAERLMVTWGIEAAELEAAGTVKPEDIVEVHRDYTGGYDTTMVSFVQAVANGFGNLRALQSKWGKTRRVYLIGHTSDIELVTQLLDSLEVQAMAALHVWQRTAPERQYQSNSERFVGSRSFLSAFGSTVGRRLAETRADATVDVTPGAALVLASKAEKVDEWMDENYPSLRKGRATRRAANYDAMAAGAEAGRTASLGEKAVGGTKGALR